MIRTKTLLATAAVLVSGAGLGGRETAADVPTAPPPREKATLSPFEVRAARWADRVASSERMLRRAEDAVKEAEADLQRVDALFAQGAIGAAQRDVQRDVARSTLAAAQIDARVAHLQAAEDRLGFVDARDLVAFAVRRNGADVTGTLAVDVVFSDADRPQVARAARDLLMATTSATAGIPAAAWDATRRLPHLHVRFPTPHRELGMSGGPRFVLAEALFPLPLTRDPGGYVLVRNGDRVVRLSGFFGDARVQFQKALSAAVPAGR